MNIVLLEPEIPWNTGNIGRTCLATGSTLHLVGKLGFNLSSREIRRAGLDYWSKVQLFIHKDFPAFIASIPKDADLFFFSTKAKQSFWKASYSPESYLIFGRETAGLPESIRRQYKDRLFKIPMIESPEVRSLNLSTSAAIVLFEALRQTCITR